jgi:diguanylate cyclase (GGDEF)-like protein
MDENARPSLADVRGLFARSANTYAGANIALARRFAMVNWILGLLVAAVLLPFFPPTQAIGSAGWAVAAACLATTLGGYAHARRRGDRVGYTYLYGATWIGMGQLALLQWLAGGRAAPFHEVYLFLIIATGLMHPPRRFALFVVGVAAAGFAPAIYAPSTAPVGEIATEQLLWLGLGIMSLLLMRNIRAQRVALKEAGDKANELARVDPLTGLGNRRAFDEALAGELEQARPAGTRLRVIVADLDGFKRINDDYGHMAGDDCLRQVADTMRATLRPGDRCFRWGGDEFVTLVADGAAGNAAGMAARLEHAIANSCRGPDGRPLSVSCGHAEIDGQVSPATAVATADAVMFSLKRRRSGAGAPGPAVSPGVPA